MATQEQCALSLQGRDSGDESDHLDNQDSSDTTEQPNVYNIKAELAKMCCESEAHKYVQNV